MTDGFTDSSGNRQAEFQLQPTPSPTRGFGKANRRLIAQQGAGFINREHTATLLKAGDFKINNRATVGDSRTALVLNRSIRQRRASGPLQPRRYKLSCRIPN